MTKQEVLGPLHKKILYTICACLWFTGVIWLYFRYGIHTQDELGPQVPPAQTMMLKIHGAAAIGFCLILGASFYHIPPGWKQRIQRFSGVLLTTCSISLILTGWGLYYIGNDQLRNITSLTHSIVGIIFPVLVFFHVWRIIQRRSKGINDK